MSAHSESDWLACNQRHLTNEVGRVRRLLEAQLHRERVAQTEAVPPTEPTAASSPDSDQSTEPVADVGIRPFALSALKEYFGLSDFERDLLLLVVGPELDSKFGTLVGQLRGDGRDGRRTAPTFSLALSALPNPHWSALTPSAPLRYWRMIEIVAGESLIASPLRVDERILHYLTGLSQLDDRIRGLIETVAWPGGLPSSHESLARRVADVWPASIPLSALPAIQLFGADLASRQAVAAVAASAAGFQLHSLRVADLPATPPERESLRRLCEREAILDGRALLIEVDDADTSDSLRATRWFVESAQTAIVISSREPIRELRRPSLRLEVGPPTSAEQAELWAQALGSAAKGLNGELAGVINQFRLGPAAIRAVATQSLARPSPIPSTSQPSPLWTACRLQSRARLDELAQRIEPAATWDDLVLPAPSEQALREITVHVRQRALVYERWGFADKGGRGLGISALFAGPSGTGKTMAAEVLARELNLDLYRIDLSQVVSKYIGETEKNLRRVFDAAEVGGAVLLFDEADALFGKRSEVKDSHDRYANIEVGYLLQRIETYRGLAILTTNFKQALDGAFLRRLRFVIQFPFPDTGHRTEIWRRIFPRATPTDGLDHAKLARLNVAGGNIRNIALNAAFLAAGSREPVRMTHLLAAARSECAKLERPPSEAELGGWI